MVRIEDIVKDALCGFLSLNLMNRTAEKIAEKAKEKKLVLIEERFCVWNDFGNKKPDVWLDETQEPIEFAIRRQGMRRSELALFDGGCFYWEQNGRRIYYKAVTHWVQMPRLLGWILK